MVGALSLGVTMGCSSKTPVPLRAVAESPGDAWDSIPLSPDWLWATGSTAGDHRSDCDRVRDAILAERPCRSSLCSHAVDLTEEWLSRCPPYMPEHELKLLRVRDSLSLRSQQSPTVCGQEAASLLRDGCVDAEACRTRVQRWAAECGKSDGTPLVIGLLERAVRRVDPDFAVGGLDLRKCDELLAGLKDAAKCVHRHRCAAELPRVDAYRTRCVAPDGYPSLQAGVLMLRVVAGAEQEVAPFGVQAGSLDQTEDPLTFESGDGAALRVCDERVDNVEEYLDARAACEGGIIRLARATAVTPNDEPYASTAAREIRQGIFDSPDDATFLARFPSMRLVGELAARDRRVKPELEKELEEIAARASAPDARGEAVRRFVTLVSKHPEAVERRTLMASLMAADASLVPVFEEIARLKVAAAGRRDLSAAERLGIARRAPDHPLADFRWDGVLEIGAPAPAARWKPERALPKAVAAYRAGLAGLDKSIQGVKLEADGAKASVEKARERAKACGEARRRIRALTTSLEACGFGLAACDEPRRSALASELDQARADRVRAEHDLFVLTTGAAYDERAALGALAREVGCTGGGEGR